MVKKKVIDRRIYVDLFGIFDDVEFYEIHRGIDKLENEFDPLRESAKFRVEHGYDYTDVYLDIYRDETDKEYKDRLKLELKAREKAQKAKLTKEQNARKILFEKEEDERKEYERLKAKFENEQKN